MITRQMQLSTTTAASISLCLHALLVIVCCCSRISPVASFQAPGPVGVVVRRTSHHVRWHAAFPRAQRSAATATATATTNDENSWSIENTEGDDDDDESARSIAPSPPIQGMEKAWRYAKKPLLSIGAKGATATHGNSLRQLLEHHVIVKVKVNTQSFDNLQDAFQRLRDLAVASGAPDTLELLQARESEKILLFGMPGTLERIQSGEFPPAPVLWEGKQQQSNEQQ